MARVRSSRMPRRARLPHFQIRDGRPMNQRVLIVGSIALDDIATQFPYIKRSTIHDTLKSLKDKGVLQIGDYNKKGYDRTCWYAFADDNVRKTAQSSKPVYFQVKDAVKYGIVAAVLLGMRICVEGKPAHLILDT